MKKITILEMLWFWVIKYPVLMFMFLVMSILSYILFPIAYFFRTKLKWDLFWPFLNDETLSGEDWWLIKYDLDPQSFWTKWRWNIRNSAWNFKIWIRPKWNLLNPYKYITIFNTTGNKWLWPNRANSSSYGWLFIFYRMDGQVQSRFGFANKWMEIQMGSAGNRYKLRWKPVWVPILIGIIIAALIYFL